CVPVTTPVAAIPDVIRDGVQGLLVAPKDVCALALALAALDDDRARLERMARAARDRVLERYTVDRLAGDFRAVYRECLA
ncbi:MAG: glycosyltransferase, partial [Burkholderiales bacterium]